MWEVGQEDGTRWAASVGEIRFLVAAGGGASCPGAPPHAMLPPSASAPHIWSNPPSCHFIVSFHHAISSCVPQMEALRAEVARSEREAATQRQRATQFEEKLAAQTSKAEEASKRVATLEASLKQLQQATSGKKGATLQVGVLWGGGRAVSSAGSLRSGD